MAMVSVLMCSKHIRQLKLSRIFIVEGVITVAVAVFAITFIVKFPDEEKTKPSWGFLKPHELDLVIDRLNADRGDAGAEKFSWKKFLEPAKVGRPITRKTNADLMFITVGLVYLRIRPDTSLRHYYSIRFRFLPTYHSVDKAEVQHGYEPVSGCPTIRGFRLPDVRRRMVQR
jgi:hypothetical protein